MTDAAATAVLTIAVPNATHSGVLKLTVFGVLGAGGGVGASESSHTITQDIAFTRVTDAVLVATQSTSYHSAIATVGAGATATTAVSVPTISGAADAAETITIRCTITKSAGASDNHTLTVIGELLSMNAGLSIAAA